MTSGTYILVYEVSETEGYVFNGKDAKQNYTTVAINNSIIDAAATVETIDIAAEGAGYSLHVADGYLSGKSGSNSIVFGASPVANTISFDEDGRAAIFSNDTYLVYNKDKTNGDRFRYYKSSTVTGSHADGYPKGYLYKLSLD